MIQPNVVSPSTLSTILSHHTSFEDSDVPVHVAPLICLIAETLRRYDLVRYLMPTFDGWRRVTRFHPKPRLEANFTYFIDDAPVHEHIRFGGRVFQRKRHSLGVTFATFVSYKNREIGVAWTTARKAHLFEFDDSSWKCVKTLNRQDVPFLTWMQFLGGNELTELERQHASDSADSMNRYVNRSPQQLFYDLVVPYYGTTEFTRSRIGMRSIGHDHAVWKIVRAASVMTFSADDPARLDWHPL